MGDVFEGWRSYDRDVVPKDAGVVQREESRRAFYAGATALFYLMLAATTEDDDGAAAKLEAIQRELDGFLSDMRI